ncbi:hypothetical protein GSI_04524 [Ganoderma sinense ZZ0214-1]|uniref:F-box domain-containing protein n=1 Tax=Ganoderma sinense ZZ0214-1 TaxID=1077348 RepID=A0A2G8SH18_9APHY|nr:hypothetical protein GSI_04524 [Ganoderma sinense ZZ0214-1]
MAGEAVVSGLAYTNALSTALSLVPPADRTELSGFSIADIRAWSVAKIDEHRRYILAFTTIQNILAPVHRLPPEILSSIFVAAWQDRRSLRLAHVCRLWRSLLLDTSQFWAVAIAGDEFRLPSDNRPDDDEDYFSACFLRSAPRRISPRLSSLSSKSHLELIRHAERITSIQISAQSRDQLELLWTVLHSGMPRLQELAIRVSDWVGGGTGPQKLSTAQLPRLTRLTLPARLFRSSWPNTLQEIALRSYYREFEFPSPIRVSLEMVLVSLEEFPNLKVLDIRDSGLSHLPDFQLPSCEFPMLERLRIRSHTFVVSAILSHVSCPASIRLDVGVTFIPRLPTEMYPVRGPMLEAVGALVDRVTITAGPTSTIRGFTSGVERLRLTVDFTGGYWFSGHVSKILDAFQRTSSPVSHLFLAQRTAQRIPGILAGMLIFPAFPHLTHLTLHARIGACREFIKELRPSLPRDYENPPVLVLLPHLKELIVGVAMRRRSEMCKVLRRRVAGADDSDEDKDGDEDGDEGEDEDEDEDGDGDSDEDDREDEDEGGAGGGDIAPDSAVAVHFSECCRLFPVVLRARMRRGHRLSRLELFSYEEGCMGKPESAVSHVGLADFGSELVKREFEPLWELVDGPVVFSGYRFFADA